jgi:hypothetical protein
LSRQPWLLRGDAKAKKFRDFVRVAGESFVSGDYEAATDNLSIEVYEAVLTAIARRSSVVPSSLWRYALLSARHWIKYGHREGMQERGQLMGSFLSFPILCLVNYITFKFLVPREVPVRINGDDIVFRATPAEIARWKEGVCNAGLVLSEGKTMVDEVFFTLNSTIFKSDRRGARGVPFLRPQALLSRPESLQGLAGQYEAVVSGAPGERRRRVRVAFLLRWKAIIAYSQRPVSEFIPKISTTVLRMAGLDKREKYYLSVSGRPGLPAPSSASAWKQTSFRGVKSVERKNIPRRERKAAEEWSRDVVGGGMAMCARAALLEPNPKRDYWAGVRRGTTPYVPIKLKPGLLSSWERLVKIMRSQGSGLHLTVRRTGLTLIAPETKGREGVGWQMPSALWWGGS